MPIWISHRGVRDGQTVENTQESFAAAVRKGFKVLETDVRITADHHLVLSHDADLGRVCEDTRALVHLTRSQIESIKLADGQSPFFLDQFLKDHASLRWVFDIKPETSRAALRIMQKVIPTWMPIERFCSHASFVVWLKEDEEFVLKAFPGAKVYAMQNECWRAGLSCLWLRGYKAGLQKDRVYAVTPEVFKQKLFTKEFVAKYHAAGAKVIAFLPRNEAEMHAAITAGCDEILSDGWIKR